jgi:hypothetical protein
LAVWCLGCSAYEPLLGALLGLTPNAIVCADERMPDSGSAGVTASEETGVLGTTWQEADSDRDLECGCPSCIAPHRAFGAGDVATVTAHEPIVLAPDLPTSIGTEPLVPPPQRFI